MYYLYCCADVVSPMPAALLMLVTTAVLSVLWLIFVGASAWARPHPALRLGFGELSLSHAL